MALVIGGRLEAGNATRFKAIEELVKPLGKQVGLSIRDRNSGKELVSVNGLELMPPASVAKTVSTACSLWALGPHHQFETVFGYTGTVRQGILQGDLVIRGGGDPGFVIEDLKEILEKVKTLYGIHQIRGRLVFDTSYFAQPLIEIASGFEGDAGRAFTARLSPVPLNFNAFSIWVALLGGQAQAEILPTDAISVKLVNQVQVKPGSSSVSFAYDPDASRVVISGQMAPGSEPRASYRALPDPYASFAKLVKRVWTEYGGRWDGFTHKIETKPVKIDVLFRHLSRPLSRLLLDINKLSTNFGADMVLMSVGAALKGLPANPEKMREALKLCIADFGISDGKLRLENASGLSRQSLTQPAALTEFLTEVEAQDYGPEYISTFSVLGRDGTTRKRLKAMEGRARLKTGTLQGVKTMAGYLYPSDGSPLVIALLFKCPSCGGGDLEVIEDKILGLLLKE